MRTIFDYINDVLVFKKGNLLDNVDNEIAFNAYLVNRWISMYSPQYCTIINNTSNRLYPIFETKQDQYQFLVNILPQTYRKRINYIKKKKDDPAKTNHASTVSKLAQNVELSEREINDYVDSGLINLDVYIKAYEN